MQKLVLIRGVPGSGKSTLAKTYNGFSHYEADMFFIDIDGNYVFDKDKIKLAHEWCQEMTRADLGFGKSVVVSNTFIKKWEMQYYLNLAKELNIEVEIVVAKGNYNNVHGVPEEIVQRMHKNFEEH